MKLTQELMAINETGEDAHAEAAAIIKKHGSSGDDAKDLTAIISDLRAAGFKKSGIVGTLGLKLKKDGVEVYAARDDIDLGDWQAHIMGSKKVAEAEEVGTDLHALHGDYKYFNKISDKIDGYIDHMDTLFKDGSQFMKLIERIGGDEKVIASARKCLFTLEDEIRHIQMSTGIAYDDKTGDKTTHEEE